MAITSYPFDAQAVTETQFSQMFREFQDSGIAASYGASGFNVTAGTGLTVNVAAGLAFLRGHMVQSTATEVVTVPAASASARADRVILRLDPAANSIVLAVKQGTPGSSTPPALTQTDTGIFEISLATVAVGANATSLTAANLDSTRSFVGSRVGAWGTNTRPAAPRYGQLGYNSWIPGWEFWNGTAWTPLLSSVDWSNLSGKPASFPPAAHTHKWADLTDAPTSLPPAGHTHDWSQVTNKPTAFAPSAHGHSWFGLWDVPTTFPPEAHAHTWASITSKPTTFPPSSHTHSGYLESGDTIAWANGSKKPHANSASGTGTYYAVWVEGDGTFCRNTSSIKFKENVSDYEIRPDDVLSLRPVIYDRKDQTAEDGTISEGRKGEVGLIAEEVAERLPWLANYLDGEVDGLRYDLLGVALRPVVQDQAARIARLERLVEELAR